MSNTRYQSDVPTCATRDDSSGARLSWLEAANAYEEHRRRLFRSPLEEEQMLMMRRPLSTEQAYRLLGTLLGALPPAAFFYRIFHNLLLRDDSGFYILLLLIMNVVCCLSGRWMGGVFGRVMATEVDKSWSHMIIVSLLAGIGWGAVSGAIGGVLFFMIGAVFGIICAVPVGILGFAMFSPIHRLLARGGMIEASHLWPLVCGITLVIVELILSY